MIEPLHNYIVVKPVVEEMSSVIITLDQNKVVPTKGKVVNAGINTEVKEGDVVLFSQFAPIKTEFEGETLLLLSIKDLYAKFN
jgi:co-chaperonin GroES (HSP10)